jgi:hypothetical protein
MSKLSSNKKNKMDSEPSRENPPAKEKSFKNFFSDTGDLFQSAWIRHPFRYCDEVDGFLLGYGRYFLLPVSGLLWALLVTFTF